MADQSKGDDPVGPRVAIVESEPSGLSAATMSPPSPGHAWTGSNMRPVPPNVRNNSVTSDQSDVLKGLLSPTVASPWTAIEPLEHEAKAPGPPAGIHWQSPASMLALFLFGLLASIAHHLFYHSLDGKTVGDDYAQQWALRSVVVVWHRQRWATPLTHLL